MYGQDVMQQQKPVEKVEQKKIEELRKAVKRLYDWGMQSDNPAMFRRAKAIQKRLDNLEENAIVRPKERKNLPINFVSNNRGGNDVLTLSKCRTKYL